MTDSVIVTEWSLIAFKKPTIKNHPWEKSRSFYIVFSWAAPVVVLT